MSLPHRQRHQLHLMGRALRATDPHLVAMLVIFARLAAGEAMPGWEHVPRRRPRLLLAAMAIVRLVIHVVVACGRGARRAVIATRWIVRSVRASSRNSSQSSRSL